MHTTTREDHLHRAHSSAPSYSLQGGTTLSPHCPPPPSIAQDASSAPDIAYRQPRQIAAHTSSPSPCRRPPSHRP
eukprot:1901080-Rhodomonas_salina.2